MLLNSMSIIDEMKLLIMPGFKCSTCGVVMWLTIIVDVKNINRARDITTSIFNNNPFSHIVVHVLLFVLVSLKRLNKII